MSLASTRVPKQKLDVQALIKRDAESNPVLADKMRRARQGVMDVCKDYQWTPKELKEFNESLPEYEIKARGYLSKSSTNLPYYLASWMLESKTYLYKYTSKRAALAAMTVQLEHTRLELLKLQGSLKISNAIAIQMVQLKEKAEDLAGENDVLRTRLNQYRDSDKLRRISCQCGLRGAKEVDLKPTFAPEGMIGTDNREDW